MANKKNPVWQEDEKVREAWIGAKSMTDIIRNLGQPFGSASYLNVKRAAERLGLPLPSGKHDNSAAVEKNRRPLSDILVERSTYTGRQNLKKRLIKEGLIKDVCVECGQPPEWNGKLLTLQVDHINGVGDDNRIENLRILCPNCHTQTSTFGFRNSSGQRVVGIPC